MFALTIYGSLLPFNFTARPFNDALDSFLRMTTIATSLLEARGDWVISAVQFSIFSFLAMAAVAVDRPARMGLVAALVVLPLCIFLAVAIEYLQIYFPPRTVSINDIIVESLGSLAGTAVWLFWGRRVTGWLRRLGSVSNIAGLAGRLIPGYVFLVLVVQLMPFDFIVGRQELFVKYNEGKMHFVPFHGPWDADALTKTLLNVVCFLPLGLLHSLASDSSQRRALAFPWAALALPPLVESLQIFVYSRSFDVTDIVSGAMGILVGTWLPRLPRRMLTGVPAIQSGNSVVRFTKTMVSLAIVLSWFGLVLYFNWRPFNFTTDPVQFASDAENLDLYGWRRMAFAPFVDYYWGNKYNALDQFLRKGISFVPLGAFLALASSMIYSTGGTRRVLIASLLVGAVVETGRYFLPDRNPSVTDLLISCAGAIAGFLFFRYVRATLWAQSNLYGELSIKPPSNATSPRSTPVAKPPVVFILFRR
jgi:VanZ family protein